MGGVLGEVRVQLSKKSCFVETQRKKAWQEKRGVDCDNYRSEANSSLPVREERDKLRCLKGF